MLMVSNALSNAFGGLLGFSIAGITSDNGYSPWRWLFIIEGCMTAGATILVFPFLPNWPSAAKWLTPQEKQAIADESKPRICVNGWICC
jgi:MFS family permease